jgi:hypothetical protein
MPSFQTVVLSQLLFQMVVEAAELVPFKKS